MKLSILTSLISVFCLRSTECSNLGKLTRNNVPFTIIHVRNASTSAFNATLQATRTTVDSSSQVKQNDDDALQKFPAHPSLVGSSVNSSAKVNVSSKILDSDATNKVISLINDDVTVIENSSSTVLNYNSSELLSVPVESVGGSDLNPASTGVIVVKNSPPRLSNRGNFKFDSGKAVDKDDGSLQSAEDAREDRLLVAVVKTLVTTAITTSVTVVFSTCATNAPTTPCRKRRKRKKQIFIPELEYSENLHSSAMTAPQIHSTHWSPPTRSRRFIIWSSSIQTVTFRVTSTNTATVVKVSYACSFAGLPSACPTG
ncbi:uncharacterized protein LOC108681452 [Hyalella azteca]|uniref:Uncharacterized protein LOC108681452 n=1 Tax=Hyalella azteca TaxID=294128 RepID=A0A8B7PJ10_HYAAZ|nr:uncharacterized protein LOC108681452 [Hyalella azteca]